MGENQEEFDYKISEQKEGVIDSAVQKEKKGYYSNYVGKFAVAIWPAMFIYVIFREVLLWITTNNPISEYGWIGYLVSEFIGMGLMLIIATVLSGVFNKQRKDESLSVFEPDGKKGKIGFGWLVLIFLMGLFLGKVGQKLGTGVTGAFWLIPQIIRKSIVAVQYQGTITSTSVDLFYVPAINVPIGFWQNFIMLINSCILAPVFEELIFRKNLMDRTSKYGARASVLLSALLFGIYQCDGTKVFYGFVLGLLFGYVYAKTHKIILTIVLHFLNNALLLGSGYFNGMLVSIKFREDIIDLTEQFIEELEHFTVAGNVDSDTALLLIKMYGYKLLDIFTNHPFAIASIVLGIIGNIVVNVLIFAGFVACVVVLILFIAKKIKLGLVKSEKGTKRCAVFNTSTIIYIAAGILITAVIFVIQCVRYTFFW